MITLILIAIAAICNGFMDMILNMYPTSIFSNTDEYNPLFWDPTVSWKNKFKNGDRTQGERFLGSTTVFVSFTDAWHLFKGLMLGAIFGSIVFFSPVFFTWWLNIIALSVIWGMFFQTTIKVLTK